MKRHAPIVTVLVLGLLSNLVVTAATSAQEDVPESLPQVNVEIILDSSGSMANPTDTGENRMDAAKRVLREVITSIPEREGAINVGFRKYGHEGDNSDATKELSCQASDLLVPVEGVDREALLGAVESAQPTGWTPIARSLLRAGKDFPEADENVLNTVVLLTDGVETCDLDPAKAARDLRRKPTVQMVTHVIGFGTTPEEQQVLSAIAENGDGLLLGAGNATELRSALFSILEELQILVGVGYVGGNAFGLVPGGEIGSLSVVAAGPLDTTRSQMPFVVRNNTAEDVVGLKVNVTVRDAGGNLLGAGDALDVKPFYVRAGGLALGFIFFGPGTSFPADATYEWDVESTPPNEARFYSQADLDIVEAALFENRIAGTAKNGYDDPVDGPFTFDVACFDENGNLLSVELGFSDAGSIAPNETQSFQVDLFLLTYQGFGCPAFLVAGQGSGTPRLPTEGGRASSASASNSPSAEPTVAVSDVPPQSPPDEAAATEDFSLPGLENAALRNFEATPGVTNGLISLGAGVFQFSSEDAADDGLDAIVDRYFTQNGTGDPTVRFSEPEQVSAPRLGDRRSALAWTITSSGIEFTAAILAIRSDNLVYFLVAFGSGINPMTELATVATTIITDEPREPPSGNLQTGGLWNLLPTLDEVPFGLSVSLEKVPEDWGPVPATESALRAWPHD